MKNHSAIAEFRIGNHSLLYGSLSDKTENDKNKFKTQATEIPFL